MHFDSQRAVKIKGCVCSCLQTNTVCVLDPNYRNDELKAGFPGMRESTFSTGVFLVISYTILQFVLPFLLLFLLSFFVFSLSLLSSLPYFSAHLPFPKQFSSGLLMGSWEGDQADSSHDLEDSASALKPIIRTESRWDLTLTNCCMPWAWSSFEQSTCEKKLRGHH